MKYPQLVPGHALMLLLTDIHSPRLELTCPKTPCIAQGAHEKNQRGHHKGQKKGCTVAPGSLVRVHGNYQPYADARGCIFTFYFKDTMCTSEILIITWAS